MDLNELQAFWALTWPKIARFVFLLHTAEGRAKAKNTKAKERQHI